MTNQLFKHIKTGQCIRVGVGEIHGEIQYIIFDDFWSLEELEEKGWRKTEDPGYLGMPPKV